MVPQSFSILNEVYHTGRVIIINLQDGFSDHNKIH